jgi:hypothetical protein
MKSIFVATPMYGGMCTGPYTFSMIVLRGVLGENNIPMHYGFMMNEALIQRARNNMVHQFLRTDATHMMFIDADIRFNAHDVLTMLEADKDIICGLYPLKEIDWRRVHQAANNGVSYDQLKDHSTNVVANLLNGEAQAQVELDKPFEVMDAGTGFMLIKREVFETLKKTVPTYINNARDLSGNVEPNAVIHNFFDTSIHPQLGVLLSEDYHFCKLWRDAGGKIFIAPWVRLGHMGAYTFER